MPLLYLCRPPHSSSKRGPSPHKSRDKRNVRGQMPIIIVPAAATANINMANAKVGFSGAVHCTLHLLHPCCLLPN